MSAKDGGGGEVWREEGEKEDFESEFGGVLEESAGVGVSWVKGELELELLVLPKTHHIGILWCRFIQ